MPFLSGNNVTLKITGTASQLTDEPTTEVSSTVFQITDAAKRILKPEGTFTVDVDATPVSDSTYTLDYLFGTITFDSSQTGSTVTISSADTDGYLPTHALANGRSITMTMTRLDLDKTVFGDSARGRTAGTAEFSAQVEMLDDGLSDIYSTTSIEDLLQAGSALVLEMDMGGDGNYLIRGWARIQQSEVSVSVEELVGETVSFSSAKRVAAMSSQDAKLWSHNL